MRAMRRPARLFSQALHPLSVPRRLGGRSAASSTHVYQRLGVGEHVIDCGDGWSSRSPSKTVIRVHLDGVVDEPVPLMALAQSEKLRVQSPHCPRGQGADRAQTIEGGHFEGEVLWARPSNVRPSLAKDAVRAQVPKRRDGRPA